MQVNYLKEFNNKKDRKRKFLSSIGIEYKDGWEERQRYLYFTFKIDRLNMLCTRDNLVPIFLTLTLPSQFHTRGKYKHIQYGSKTIKEGYIYLNNMFRDIIKNFKVDNKYSRIKYVKVIEPHKDFTPHLHSLLYIKEEHLQKVLGYLHYKIKKYNLKQTDIKILDRADYATTYLLKYIQKSFTDSAIRGWAQYNKIRQYTMSQTGDLLDFATFRILTKYIKYDKEDKRDYITQLLSNVTIYRTTHYTDLTIKEDMHYSSDAKFSLHILRKVYTQKVIEDNLEEEIIELDNPYYKILSYHFFNKDNYMLECKIQLFSVKERLPLFVEDKQGNIEQLHYLDIYS